MTMKIDSQLMDAPATQGLPEVDDDEDRQPRRGFLK